MPLNHKHKLLFVHIPKNAGTSIEYYFGMMKPKLFYGTNSITEGKVLFSPQHLTPPLLKKKLGDKIYGEYFKFAFVRHPNERVISEFFWQQRINQIPKNMNFKKWVFSYYKKIDTDHKLPQHHYVYDKDGKIMIDFLGKVENINEDFDRMLKKINYKTNNKLPKRNVNSSSYNLNMMDEDIKNFIYEIYKNDFKYFNYGK